MPIEVHCPNPGCAKVHLVKNSYAGKRGKCPACGSWMLIPASGMMPSTIAPRPQGLEQTVGWTAKENTPPPAPAPRRETVKASPKPALLDEDEDLPPLRPEKPKAKPRLRDEDESLQPAPESDEKPARAFSWFVFLVLLLATLSVGGVLGGMFLDGPTIICSGEFASRYSKVKLDGLGDEQGPIYLGLAGGLTGMGVLALLAGFVGKRFGMVSGLLSYLAVLLGGLLLFLTVDFYQKQQALADKWDRTFEHAKDKGVSGDASYDLGPRLKLALGGSAAGSFFFLLAAVLIHRRWWSRLLCFVLLGLYLGIGLVWNFRKDLGIADMIPDFDKML